LAKKKGLRFQTEKKRQASRTRRFFFGFLIFILVFGSVSALFFLKSVDFNISNLFKGANDDAETSEQTTAPEVFSGSANFLVFCSDRDNQALHFIAVIRADLNREDFRVCTLSPKERATVGGKNATLFEHFGSGGEIRLVEAVEKMGSLKIDRYIGSDEKGFKDAVNKMGALTVEIKEKINFENDDFMLSLVEGRQGLKGDSLNKYMKYCSFKGDEGLDRQAEIICSMLEQYINTDNLEDGEEFFGALINLVESNISIVDYTSSEEYLNHIASKETGIRACAIIELKDLK
jgi:anionic cell wall polymer biosynthesis LytR-Cps2A-Psr (LCP) family protein